MTPCIMRGLLSCNTPIYAGLKHFESVFAMSTACNTTLERFSQSVKITVCTMRGLLSCITPNDAGRSNSITILTRVVVYFLFWVRVKLGSSIRSSTRRVQWMRVGKIWQLDGSINSMGVSTRSVPLYHLLSLSRFPSPSSFPACLAVDLPPSPHPSFFFSSSPQTSDYRPTTTTKRETCARAAWKTVHMHRWSFIDQTPFLLRRTACLPPFSLFVFLSD